MRIARTIMKSWQVIEATMTLLITLFTEHAEYILLTRKVMPPVFLISSLMCRCAE